MTQQINSTIVSDDLYSHAKSVTQRGGRCFLAMPEGGLDYDCSNCGGGSKLVLQVVVGGPSVTPMPGRGQGNGKDGDDQGINIYQDSKWYLVKCKSYKCPVCNGISGPVGKRVANGKVKVSVAQLTAAMGGTQ